MVICSIQPERIWPSPSPFYAIWLTASLLTNKFQLSRYQNYFRGMLTLVKADVLVLYCVLCLAFVFGLPGYGHFYFFQAVLILFLLETALFTEYTFRLGHDFVSFISREALRRATYGKSLFLFTADLCLFAFSFMAVNYISNSTFHPDAAGVRMLLVLYAIWLGASLFTRKFQHRRITKVHQLISPNVKAIVLTMLCFYTFVSLVELVQISHFQVLGTLGMSMSLGVIPSVLYSVVKQGRKWEAHDIESAAEVKQLLQQEALLIEPDDVSVEEVGVETSLRDSFLNSFPQLFAALRDVIDLSAIALRRTEVFYSNTNLNALGLRDQSVQLMLNLDRVNDIGSLNRYFLDVHKKLSNGGVFVCQAETIDIHRRKFRSRFPDTLGKVLYLAHFFYARILPRIPGLRYIYLAFSRGRNQALSRAELLGRLYFCGFKVLAARTIDDKSYVIARKVKKPSRDSNPSNDLLLQMKRIGYGGEVVLLHKFRTMYPYSEYLQEYVYEKYRLQSNGKFRSDFRITEWGKIFRKFWIDELPQFINYFRGELNIVGVRALSKHYFDLYPEDLQKLRTQFKPGLIPPYYYDLPQSFDEILDSERRYLLQKQVRPLSTDIKYLAIAFYNIVLRGARSK